MTARLGPAARGAVGLSIGFVAFFSVIGADSRWLGALGAAIVRDGRIPHGVPYAAAPSGSWPNVTALAELVFHGCSPRARGLAGGATGRRRGRIRRSSLATLAGPARATGRSRPSCSSRSSEPSRRSAVVRVQLFSIALFPVLFSLLRAEARRPGRTVWLVVPLLTLWSNLHGAVLVGLAMLLVYLVLERARQRAARGALRGGCGWARLLPHAGLRADAPLLRRRPGERGGAAGRRACGRRCRCPAVRHRARARGLCLLALAVRSRPRLWELAALLALAGLTVHAARSGVWLLLAAAPGGRARARRRCARRARA